MDPEDVREYVDRSRRVIDTDSELDEQNTKVKLIQPLIRLLGWDIYAEEVELEYPVQIGTRRTRVDYALLIEGSPAMFVEAKACRDDVSESDVRQLQSYMRQAIEVEWGVLTNGRTFEVLKAADGNREEMTIATFDLDDLASTPHVLELLTRSSIGSGRSTGIARRVAQRDDAIRQLQGNRETIAEEVSETLLAHLGEETPIDVERRVDAFVDDLVTALEEQRTAIGPITSDGNTDESEGSTQVPIHQVIQKNGDGGSDDGSGSTSASDGGSATSGTGRAPDTGAVGRDGGEAAAQFRQLVREGVQQDRGSTARPRNTGTGAAATEEGWVPAPESEVGIGTVSRADVEGDPGSTVALLPVSVPGFDFYADDVWQTPSVSGAPAFLAMHVDGSRGEIRYVARVRDVVPVEEADGVHSGKDVEVGADLVRLEPGTLHELKDPIPAGTRHPRSVRYTDLGSFKRARTTGDLL